MEIHFKFKSLTDFDSVIIGPHSSVSVHHLKSLILKRFNASLTSFDLVFSDAVSGLEYTDENTQILGGSSVIINRVPFKWLRNVDVSAGHDVEMDARHPNFSKPPVPNFALNGWDDREVTELLDYRNQESNIEKRNSYFRRCCSMKPPVGGVNLESTSRVPSNPKDAAANERNVQRPKPVIKEQARLDRAVAVKHIAMESVDLPKELICPICKTYFKQAVQIPCCNYSFCQTCICQTLVESSRCPKCSSIKYKPEDLIPNFALTGTVVSFLESRGLDIASEKDLVRYVPDGESGIQAKKNADKAQQKEFDGENEPEETEGTDEEAHSSPMKGQYRHESEDCIHPIYPGGERDFIAPGRLKQACYTCGRCGSQDHLTTDCPTPANSCAGSWTVSRPLQVPGYVPQYWPGNPSYVRPPYNMNCGSQMMMYNTNISPATPFAMSPYASPMFNSYPATRGPLMPGVMAPFPGTIAPQNNQIGNRPPLGAKQRRGHTEAIVIGRKEVLDQDHEADKQPDYTERGANHSNDSVIKRSSHHRSHEHLDDDDQYSNGKGREIISEFSEGGRNLRNGHLEKSSEKVMPDRRDSKIGPLVERLNQDHKAFKKSDYAERRPKHSNDDFTRRSGHRRSHEYSDDEDQYSYGKKWEKISRSSEGGRYLRNGHLAKSTPEKVTPGSGVQSVVERHDNSHRRSERNEEVRMQHDGEFGQLHHHSSKDSRLKRRMEYERSDQHDGDSDQIHPYFNKASMQKKRREHHRYDREFYSHTISGLDHYYSNSDGRERRNESGSRSRHSEKKSRSNSKDKYRDWERMSKYSDDNYEEEYQSYKRRRCH